MKGFTNFIREQGVAGLIVGFMIGTAANQFVQTFVGGIVDPLLGLVFDVDTLAAKYTMVGDAQLAWGAVLTLLVNLLVTLLVVYLFFISLGLNKLDKKSDNAAVAAPAKSKTAKTAAKKKTAKK